MSLEAAAKFGRGLRITGSIERWCIDGSISSRSTLLLPLFLGAPTRSFINRYFCGASAPISHTRRISAGRDDRQASPSGGGGGAASLCLERRCPPRIKPDARAAVSGEEY